MSFHTSSQLSLLVMCIYRQADNAEGAELFGGGRRLLQKRTFIGVRFRVVRPFIGLIRT